MMNDECGMIALTEEPIRAANWVSRCASPEAGAVAAFEGVVRNNARGKKVSRLEYHAYRPMALLQMEKIRHKALEQFPILEVALVHRLGTLAIGETSVLVVVVAAHREAAFAACRYCIDTLKQTVPIWKKEFGEGGECWIEGDQAAMIHEASGGNSEKPPTPTSTTAPTPTTTSTSSTTSTFTGRGRDRT